MNTLAEFVLLISTEYPEGNKGPSTRKNSKGFTELEAMTIILGSSCQRPTKKK